MTEVFAHCSGEPHKTGCALLCSKKPQKATCLEFSSFGPCPTLGMTFEGYLSPFLVAMAE